MGTSVQGGHTNTLPHGDPRLANNESLTLRVRILNHAAQPAQAVASAGLAGAATALPARLIHGALTLAWGLRAWGPATERHGHFVRDSSAASIARHCCFLTEAECTLATAALVGGRLYFCARGHMRACSHTNTHTVYES